jgi:hypothetical protein
MTDLYRVCATAGCNCSAAAMKLASITTLLAML